MSEIWIAGTIDEVIASARTGIPTAIVTNPTVIAQWTTDGKTLEACVKEVTSATDLPLYIQLRGPDAETMRAEGDALAAISEQVCIKLPSTLEGFEATGYFARKGKKTLVTTICSLQQAYLAACVGAHAVCPYMSRLDESGESSVELIKKMAKLYAAQSEKPAIFPASVRSTSQIAEALEAGSTGVIIFDNLFRSMTEHKVTHSSLENFEKDDWSRIPYEFSK